MVRMKIWLQFLQPITESIWVYFYYCICIMDKCMFPDNRGQFSVSGANQVNESGIFRKGNDISEYQIQKTHLDMLKVFFSF